MPKASSPKIDQIWTAIQGIQAGVPLKEVARAAQVTVPTIKKWRAKYGEVSSRESLDIILNPEDNRYVSVMRKLFKDKYVRGDVGFDWERSELDRIAAGLGINKVLNLGDNIYAIRHGRDDLPREIRSMAPPNKEWLLLPNGKSAYRFVLVDRAFLDPDTSKEPIKIPDSTPQIVSRNAKQDEQAVLARIRYCRLVDIFMGLASFQLQSHMRTTITHFNGAQTELDEIYVGVDANGTQFVIPIQAKSLGERIGAIQIITDHYVCREKFPAMVTRTLAATIVRRETLADFGEVLTIALVEGRVGENYNVTKIREEHFKLVPSAAITEDDLALYRQRFTR